MLRVTFFCFIYLPFALSLVAHAQENACTVCHSNKTAGDVHTAVKSSCEDCHGDGAQHIAQASAGGVMTFKDEAAKTRTAACKACHQGLRASGISSHSRVGIACNDCHNIHQSSADEATPKALIDFERIGNGSRPCFACHQEVFSEFGFSERHRLKEDVLTCASCHNPHGPKTQARLSGARSDRCAECHAAQSGPFVFEHDASRVDGCIACHDAHGSPNRHLLVHQKSGELCYSCHATVPQFHLGFAPGSSPRFGADTVCTNCHVAIHGSNIDRNFLK